LLRGASLLDNSVVDGGNR